MRFIGSFLLLVTFLFGADAYVSKSSIVMGERVILVLSADGSSVKFPNISSIGGFEITSTIMEQNIEYRNGKKIRRLEKHYAFTPLQTIDIASFEIEVDGKKEFTKSLHVEVRKVDYTNSPFKLEMKIRKQDVMQFEAVPIEFIFRRDKNYEVRDLRFSPPKFANFWVKEGKKSKPYLENGFIVHKMDFFIFPQKSGNFKIAPAKVDVGVISKSKDIFNVLRNQLDWKTVFSNSVPLHVKKLEGTNLYGNFHISFEVDKKTIEQNTGVNATLKIVGSGNFDDIEAYKLSIKGVNIYIDKPIVNSKPTVRGMKGEFIQKFSISSAKSFIIPSLSITYYDAKEEKLVTKKTDPINIDVKNGLQEIPLQLSEVKKEVIAKNINNYLYLFFSFIVGIVTTLLSIFLLINRKYKFLKFKNDRDRLKSLFKRRGENKEIDRQIEELERKLYKKSL
jgi:hypothetical protein